MSDHLLANTPPSTLTPLSFHCIYWPAFLMALDIPLPKHILTHGHWTLGREKMSKSTGNVVNPFFAIDRFGVDVMRFYLAHDGSTTKDADYNNEYIIERYKKALGAGFGNLTSRITRGKGWSVKRAVERFTTGELQGWEDPMLVEQYNMLKHIPDVVKHRMHHLDIHTAVKKCMSMVYAVSCHDICKRRPVFDHSQTNAFFQHTKPWSLVPPKPKPSSSEPQAQASTSPTADTTEIDRIIYLSAEALRIAGILLQPVMPEKMPRMLDMLGVSQEARTLEYAEVGKDKEYGTSSVELGRGVEGTLFPPLACDE